MTTPKSAALRRSPATKIAVAQERPPQARSRASKVPDKFTYALRQFTAELRATGWWISRTWTSAAGEKPEWKGPFATIETACLAIARRLAIEIADRHTQMIEWHGIEETSPLYSLKATTRLRQKRTKVSAAKA
jgi:hypothetical protein